MPSITVQIDHGSLDAHEYGGGSTVDVTGNVLNASASNQWVGLVFANAGLADLDGATITSAYLELYFTSGSYDDPDATIYGWKNSYNLYFLGTNGELSGSGPSTTATVNWAASNLGTGWKQSPDIKTIIQEIIDVSGWPEPREGWINTSGITIFYKGNSGATGMRVRSYEGNSSQAAKLIINYDVPASGQPAIARARTVPGMRRPHGSQGW